jgi:hypothetical protein
MRRCWKFVEGGGEGNSIVPLFRPPALQRVTALVAAQCRRKGGPWGSLLPVVRLTVAHTQYICDKWICSNFVSYTRLPLFVT